ncbi:MAG: Ig-like domain-containing protein, partial [Betaproteobacteria bacterium]
MRSRVATVRRSKPSRLLGWLLGRIAGFLSGFRMHARSASQALRKPRVVFESLEPRLLLSADLVGEVSVPALGHPVVPGDAIVIPVVLRNLGTDPVAAPVSVKLFASLDGTLDAGDILLGTAATAGVLDPNGSIRFDIDVGVPGPGTYALFAQVDADGSVAESDETNNIARSAQSLSVQALFGEVPGHADSVPLGLTDADGTLVTFALSGRGVGSIVATDDGYALSLDGTDATSAVSITASGGDGTFVLVGVTAAGPLRSFDAEAATLRGDLVVGRIDALALGDIAGPLTLTIGAGSAGTTFSARHVSDASIVADSPLKSVTVLSWLDTDATADSIAAPALDKLVVTGDLEAGLQLSGAGASGFVLGNASVGGRIAHGRWNVQGRSGPISAGTTGADWFAAFTAPVTSVTTKGDFSGRLYAPALQVLQVGGDVVDAAIFIGANLGADGMLGGTGADADTFGAGNLNRVRIVGGVSDASIHVGVDPVNGVFDDGNDLVASGGRIQELLVGGALGPGARVVAGTFPPGVRINGLVTAPGAAAGLSTRSADIVAPVLAVQLRNDTGVSSVDGLTGDPTITGQVTDLGGVVLLQAAFGTGALVDVTSSLGAGGAFTLDRAALERINGGALTDGTKRLRVSARDGAGNQSEAVELMFELDTTAPALSVALTSADAIAGTDDTAAAAVVQLKGIGEAGAVVVLASQGLSVVAGAGGQFIIPGVALAVGANVLELTSTDAAGNTATLSRTITRVEQTRADTVLAWNEIALRAIQLDATDPPVATRTLAMMSLAQYDTLAAIEGTPAYLVALSVTGAVDVDAALATAAHRILSLAYPALKSVFDTALAAALGAIADGAAKDTGIALGLSVADAIWAARSHDGSDAFVDFPGSDAVGEWRPTGPMFSLPNEPQWQYVTPFALSSASEFRAPPPPALDSAAYAASVNEIKALGSATSTTRTDDQTQAAQFWADGKGSYTPPGHWNQIATQTAEAMGNSLSANVRLFAQLNVALADAAIACWDTKYTYDLWRPETAIHLADLDGNDATDPDTAWRALLITPAHPEYTSGHSTFSWAAATVLAANFGDDTAFATTSATLPGVTREFASFSDAAAEAGRSRVYGGIHYQFTNAAGQVQGQAVGNAVLARFALTDDTQAPTVAAADSASVVRSNLTLIGQIFDNLSGVASAQYRVDGGALHDLVLGDQGAFSLTTGFALDGADDGAHWI